MGRSRGGLTSKVHAVVDANGLPVRLGLTSGEAHDNQLCPVLLPPSRASGGAARAGSDGGLEQIEDAVGQGRGKGPERQSEPGQDEKPVMGRKGAVVVKAVHCLSLKYETSLRRIG